MFSTVSSFTLSSYPGKPILEALTLLTDGLRECSLKSAPANLSMTAALEELRNKFSSLLVRDSKMTPAQVILNSMYGLFQMTELSTLKLFDMIDNIHIPKEWDSVDLIKQTSSLMHSSNNPMLADDLLFVRKAQAIIEFCMECQNLLKAFKLDIKPPDCELFVCGLLLWLPADTCSLVCAYLLHNVGYHSYYLPLYVSLLEGAGWASEWNSRNLHPAAKGCGFAPTSIFPLILCDF